MHYQALPSDKDILNEFDIKMIVAGTRNFNDYILFSKCMNRIVSTLTDKSIIFISGKAKTGADALIIRWCIEHKHKWVEFPADWNIGKSAGYIRNLEMAKVGNMLVSFYDGMSRGTKHMIDTAIKKKIPVYTNLINVN